MITVDMHDFLPMTRQDILNRLQCERAAWVAQQDRAERTRRSCTALVTHGWVIVTEDMGCGIDLQGRSVAVEPYLPGLLACTQARAEAIAAHADGFSAVRADQVPALRIQVLDTLLQLFA